MGVNTKVIHRNVGKFAKSWGLGFDLGGIYLQEQWQFGLMLRDITTTFNAWFHNAEMVREIYAKTNNEVPVNSLELTLPRAILSVSRQFDAGEYFGVQAVMDLDMTFDGQRNTLLKTELGSLDPRLGVEASYKDMAFIRGGVKNFQYIKDFDGSTSIAFQPTFGLGVLLSEKAFIDYALTDIGSISETPYSHVFSLKMSFNPLSEGFRLFDGWEDY